RGPRRCGALFPPLFPFLGPLLGPWSRDLARQPREETIAIGPRKLGPRRSKHSGLDGWIEGRRSRRAAGVRAVPGVVLNALAGVDHRREMVVAVIEDEALD